MCRLPFISAAILPARAIATAWPASSLYARALQVRMARPSSQAGFCDFAMIWSTASNASAAYITEGPAPM